MTGQIAARLVPAALLLFSWTASGRETLKPKDPKPQFQTSDRCIACHNGLVTPSGEDVSIGFAWRASIMANSSRDPYWQASVRRETIDHPESKADIEDECSICHMPITRYEAKLQNRKGEIFSHLPFTAVTGEEYPAEDGVSCSVCHQIGKERLGTRESFSGGFVIDPAISKDDRPEYGPFKIEQGQKRIMRTSTEGFRPTEDEHIRDSKLCATCHTLYTSARGAGGKIVGELAEQMPYLEWLHSDYKDKKSCQSCHMPLIEEAAPITRVLGVPREEARRHVFVGGNFFMLNMLNRFRDELSVWALPPELASVSERTARFLGSQSARLTIDNVAVHAGTFDAEVFVENLNGHKLPSAFPSRRAWIHFVVRGRDNRIAFESGALRADGLIEGNDNDADPKRYEPHYREIRAGDQVQIYESILGDEKGAVTTGLLTAVGYLKDNRLLPDGFDKRTADKDIAVRGAALEAPNFVGGSDRVKYSVPLGNAEGPYTVEAELWYQPIGYRWANNLKPYDRSAEPRRFNRYYDSMAGSASIVLARAKR